MSEFPPAPHSRIQRLPERGRYDRETIYRIIDEALICHVAFVQDEQPFVIPMLHARQDDCLLLHGASRSRLLEHIQAGHPVSVSLALLDGLVLARSVFNHSVNYRSVVLFGRGRPVEDDAEKLSALEAFTERLLPGRWQAARKPTAAELKATRIVALDIEAASAKVRSGPPKDPPADADLPVWAGVLPLRLAVDEPVSAENSAGLPVPDHVAEYLRRAQGGA